MLHLHRIVEPDAVRTGVWMVDGYGLMLAPIGAGGGRDGRRWQIAPHNLAPMSLRLWLQSALPSEDDRRYPSLRAARSALGDAMRRFQPPADAGMALPSVLPVSSGLWRTREGDFVLRRESSRWALERNQLTFGGHADLPAKTMSGARSLYEARMLVAYVRDHESGRRY